MDAGGAPAACSVVPLVAGGIGSVRLTQATVRHLPEGPGPELDRLAAHLSRCARTPRGWARVPSTPAAARDSWAAAFSFPLSGVGEPDPAWRGRLSLPRDRSRSVAGPADIAAR
ncbi:hypothetical protein ACPA9J_31965 [Pseudomonas aeruginosa]